LLAANSELLATRDLLFQTAIGQLQRIFSERSYRDSGENNRLRRGYGALFMSTLMPEACSSRPSLAFHTPFGSNGMYTMP